MVEDFSLPPFTIHSPARVTSPVVLSSPHSGRFYSDSFRKKARLDEQSLRRSEDCFVDELFSGCVDAGMSLIAATYPRAYLDLNREAYELDPMVFQGPLPSYANSRSDRVLAGLGTIARIVASGMPIYRQPISVADGLARIDRIYHPFHAALGRLLRQARLHHSVALLVDCHSMPSGVLHGHNPGRLPDIVLGDRFGRSCAQPVVLAAERYLSQRGYRVSRNTPYAGGYCTGTYGRPRRGVHALQIELNRRLYMDEASLQPLEGFARLRQDLSGLVQVIHQALIGLQVPEPRLIDDLRDAAE